MAYLVSKWRENCVLSAHSSFGAFGLTPGPLGGNSEAVFKFSTGVNSVPGFSKNHTVTNAIFVHADCSASERSPARCVITAIKILSNYYYLENFTRVQTKLDSTYSHYNYYYLSLGSPNSNISPHSYTSLSYSSSSITREGHTYAVCPLPLHL